ncbi:hypothetical protein WJR50_06795 [Catalinimonas sp. 4WD22]|uniref:hypothetical protein n=1 Tax=Catalinimonas locisalis TaxID=3133978 RepID=UPI003101466F
MHKTMVFNRNLISFGVPLALLGVLVLLLKSPFPVENEALSLAITADLLLTVPLVYFLLIRKTEIPKTTVLPVMLIGLLIGSYFLPKESQTYLGLYKTWALPVLELTILSFVVVKARKAIKTYHGLKGATPDFYDALKSACYEILPRPLVIPFATEVAVFYYGFVHWKKRSIRETEFTYHQKSGTPSLFGGLILLIIIETIALHVLLIRWSPMAAWILSGLSIYTAIQVFGFAKALSQRPISMGSGKLSLRYGIMNETHIPYSDIASVVLSKQELGKDKRTTTLSPLGELESHNIIITLKRENTLVGLYGIHKKFKVIALYIDEADDFKEMLENALDQAV